MSTIKRRRRVTRRMWYALAGMLHGEFYRKYDRKRSRWIYYAIWTVALAAIVYAGPACSRASWPTAPTPGVGTGLSLLPAAAYDLPAARYRWDVLATAPGCVIARPVPALTYDNTPVQVEALSVPAGAYRVTYQPARNTVIAGVFVPDPQLKAGIYALCSWERVR